MRSGLSQNLCSLGKVSEGEKNPLGISMVITFCKTISNINTDSLTACKQDTHLQFLHFGWYIGWKSDHNCQFTV